MGDEHRRDSLVAMDARKKTAREMVKIRISLESIKMKSLPQQRLKVSLDV
jgi:hypothetical protein